jgi:hypothetical protein
VRSKRRVSLYSHSPSPFALQPPQPFMIYWIHIARSIDRVTLHKDRCSEVPSVHSSSDFWEGGWFDYPDKERALAAMEMAGTTDQRRCALCKP